MIARVNSLSLDPEVLTPDSVPRLQDFQSLPYKFLTATESAAVLLKSSWRVLVVLGLTRCDGVVLGGDRPSG